MSTANPTYIRIVHRTTVCTTDMYRSSYALTNVIQELVQFRINAIAYAATTSTCVTMFCNAFFSLTFTGELCVSKIL